jgi:hypothetical protein
MKSSQERRGKRRVGVQEKQWQAAAKLGSSRLELKPSRLKPREKRLAQLGLNAARLDRLAKLSQAAATLVQALFGLRRIAYLSDAYLHSPRLFRYDLCLVDCKTSGDFCDFAALDVYASTYSSIPLGLNARQSHALRAQAFWLPPVRIQTQLDVRPVTDLSYEDKSFIETTDLSHRQNGHRSSWMSLPRANRERAPFLIQPRVCCLFRHTQASRRLSLETLRIPTA